MVGLTLAFGKRKKKSGAGGFWISRETREENRALMNVSCLMLRPGRSQ